jgi:outer membrane lipoprotein SlyB
VPIETLANEIDNLKAFYKSDRDAEAIYRQIDSAVDTLKKMNPSGEISVEDLNIFKRTTMNGAFNKAGDKVSDAVEYDIGDIVYNNLANALERSGVRIGEQSLREFNAEYSAILNARKLLKIAAGRKQAGFLAKLLSGIAGASLGSAFGGPLGAAAGTVVAPALSEAIAGGAARTGTAAILDQLSKLSALDLLKILYGSMPKD